MTIPFNSLLHIALGIGSVFVAVAFLLIRLRGSKNPVSLMKIIMPPLGMSTGFLMFLYPPMRIPWEWGVIAFLIGAIVLSYPLIQTTTFEKVDGFLYVKRSKAFILILIVLMMIRISLHRYIENFISIEQTGSLFFILAFGMLLPWRISMLIKYRKMMNK